jgi:small-conductance mechanosensitive channel
MTSPSPFQSLVHMNDTVMERMYGHFFGQGSSTGMRLLLIVGLAVAAHGLVKVVRHLSEWLIYNNHAQRNPLGFMTRKPKFITLTRLIVSGVTFVIYFLALGFVLEEIGVNLNAYLASASVIGLAISFGSQGLIQDIVIGLTLIFWDAMNVGDMVEIYASTPIIGRVEEIGMRFTKLINFYNQVVFIPNRTIANVSRFPEGGVDAYADVQVPPDAAPDKAVEIVGAVARSLWAQFGAIVLSEPVIGRVETAQGGGWSFFRVHFKIWPGQGNLIETTFRQQVVTSMQALDPQFADWQVPVTYRALAVPLKI